MSSIYITEPPTKGKVILHTTFGDIEIELWPKESPKAVKNFTQLCLEGYYNDCLFHRLIPNFIIQTGDRSGTGEGGESIYGEAFGNEIHSRLRFSHRGIVAMAGTFEDDSQFVPGEKKNMSQFFITLDKTPSLQNKHTIFGKVVGDTIYNVLKMNDLEIDDDDRPLFPPKINKVSVPSLPFPIEEFQLRNKLWYKEEEKKEEKKPIKKELKSKVKLSFEEDGEEIFVKKRQKVSSKETAGQIKKPIEKPNIEAIVEMSKPEIVLKEKEPVKETIKEKEIFMPEKKGPAITEKPKKKNKSLLQMETESFLKQNQSKILFNKKKQKVDEEEVLKKLLSFQSKLKQQEPSTRDSNIEKNFQKEPEICSLHHLPFHKCLSCQKPTFNNQDLKPLPKEEWMSHTLKFEKSKAPNPDDTLVVIDSGKSSNGEMKEWSKQTASRNLL